MKRLVLMLLFTCSFFSPQAQDTATVAKTSTGPAITFKESLYNFGNIQAGDTVSYVFTFTNSGTGPLLLFNVQTSCGCTAPSWPKAPILAGEQGKVKITFNSTGKKGVQNKTITVVSNAENKSSYGLVLQGEVTPKSTN